MIRRKLSIVAFVVAIFALSACADATAPSSDVCQIVAGSSTC
ncbi:MAG: hypothetical protein ACRENI_03250 [Gemmatimonadaceae bacterium]